MNNTINGPAPNSIEALTLDSLDQSLEGLEMLRRLSMQCGQGLAEDRDQGLQNDVVSLFGIPTEQIRDAKGTLKSEETRLTETMGRMAELADKQNWSALGELLRVDFPLVIDRFEDLLPTLRNRIENDYVVCNY
jgi:hypothetical protein